MKVRISLFDSINYALLALFACAMLFPFLHMAAVSISAAEYVLANQISVWPRGINFDAYIAVLRDERIAIGYRNTILYVVLGTSLSILFTILGAYPLSRRNFVFGRTFMLLIVFSMMFNGGLIPTYLVIRNYHLLDTIWAMVLPGLVSSWFLIIMRTFFQGIPKEIEESGKMDGLSELGNLLRIVLPLSVPVLLTISLFYAVAIWGNFYNALIYIRDANLYPLQVVIRNIVLIGQVSDTTVSSAMGDKTVVLESLKYAVILVGTLPVLLLYPFIQKHFAQGVMVGSVKG
jgi:putative aldouronate transport system permease protein